jgi:hypothetical protein
VYLQDGEDRLSSGIAGRSEPTMSKKRKKKLIEFSEFDEERYSRWTLAVDKTVCDLKPCLEKLSFHVKPFYGEQYAPELDESLIEAKVDFFITTRGKAFERYTRRYFRKNYNLLWISEHLLDDPPRTAKAIEDAILYDPWLNSWWGANSVKITGQYITWLPRLKKEWLRKKKK